MIQPKELIDLLKRNKINFFTGVPDSVLKNLSPYFEKNKKKHISAVNEGNAIAIASGYHMATKKIPCVYFQNSGLGNAVNPLASIVHSKVYSIPMLLIIGWRGSPNLKDEPQHKVKGKITKDILKLLDIKFCILRNKKDLNKLKLLIKYSKSRNKPVACLIENKILNKGAKNKIAKNRKFNIKRIEVINELLKNLSIKTNIVSTTGFTSRELMEIRKKEKMGNDFYMVGGMGHTSALSLSISLHSKKQMICLDGDGSMLMHMGSLVTIGFLAKKNFKHILFNNNAHESVGGQKTNIDKVNFENLTKSIGYKKYIILKNKKDLKKKLKVFLQSKGPIFMEILISQGSVKNLMRPKNLLKIKRNFIQNI